MSQFRALPSQFKPQTLCGMKLSVFGHRRGICGINGTYGSDFYPNPFTVCIPKKSDLEDTQMVDFSLTFRSTVEYFYRTRLYPRFLCWRQLLVPYCSHSPHLYETMGWWRKADWLKVHFAESWNELHPHCRVTRWQSILD